MGFLKKIGNVIEFILTGKGQIAEEAIENDLLSYSGQGRDDYGE